MNKTTVLGIVSIALLATAACSDDEATPRPTNMNGTGGGTMNGTGGTATAGTGGTATAGTGGTATAGTGGGSTATTANYGTAFTVDDNTIIGTDEAIAGNVFSGANGLNADFIGATPPDTTASHLAAFSATGDTICMSGTIKAVPDANSYGTHWGVQAGVNLNVPGTAAAAETTTGATDADAGVGDAGAAGDAAAPAPDNDTPEPWAPGAVLGFSFTITGDNPPPAMRFLSAPDAEQIDFDAIPGVGGIGDLNFCSGFTPFSGDNVNILFTDIVDRCWGDPARTEYVFPLTSIAWQIPSDVGPANNFEYDFCISNIRAIVP